MAKTIRDYEDFDDINVNTTNYMAYINSIPLDERMAYEDRIEKEPIKYDDSISLMDIGRKLNDLYVAFMKDYNALPVKLDVGEELDIQDYRERQYDDGFHRSAQLFIYKNNQIKGNKSSLEFVVIDSNGEIKNFVNNRFCCTIFDKRYICTRLDLDKDVLKSYLDLFQRHQEFIKVFANHESVSLSNQTWVMMGLYKDRDLNITDGLKTLQIHGYLSDSYNFIFDIYFKLGENFGIDFEKTKFLVHDREVKFTEEDIIDFANSIFVNKYYILTGINKGPLYCQYDIYDPKVQYKYCEFSEKLKEKFGRIFNISEVISILKNMIDVYSEPIDLYLGYTKCKDKDKLLNRIAALFAIETYDNIIHSYEQTISKESSSKKRDNQ